MKGYASVAYMPLDGRLELDRLAALAAEFDRIEPGASYPAAEFVTWLRREVEWRTEVERHKRRRRCAV